jgi:hypothetical protein
MCVIIVGKLGCWQEWLPIVLLVLDVVPEVLIHCLVGNFGLVVVGLLVGQMFIFGKDPAGGNKLCY